MKFFIASDIHGSAYYCEKMFEAFGRENADRILLLGDLLYHGPRNNLPEEYLPKKVIELLNAHKDKIFCVRGNCDAEVDQMVLDFPIMADYCLIEQKGRPVFVTHGHKFNLDNLPLLKKGDVLLNGHTHVPELIKTESVIYMNCGSVSLPKRNCRHSYMTVQDGVFIWKDLDGDEFERCEL